MIEFMVIDLQTESIDPEPKTVFANSAERAAELALGLSLVHSGSKNNLRARVYSTRQGQPTSMVRLYTKVSDSRPASQTTDFHSSAVRKSSQ